MTILIVCLDCYLPEEGPEVDPDRPLIVAMDEEGREETLCLGCLASRRLAGQSLQVTGPPLTDLQATRARAAGYDVPERSLHRYLTNADRGLPGGRGVRR